MAKDNRMNGAQKDGSNFLRRNAKEVKFHRLMLKILPAAAGAMSALLVVTFVAAMMYREYGSFTVTVNKLDNVEYGLSLSEYRDFNAPTERLNSKASKEITNISVVDLPKDLDTQDGEHNGDNYVAYTFYAKNTGKTTVDVEYQVFIRNMTLGVEHAVRVRLYTGDTFLQGEDAPNRSYVDYARAPTNGDLAEPGTTPFYSTKIIARGEVHELEPGEMMKYTVVVWLEGDDPECIDNVLGGEFKIDMSLRILGIDDKGNPITETEPPTGDVPFEPTPDSPYEEG